MNFEVDEAKLPQTLLGEPRPFAVIELNVAKVDAFWSRRESRDYIAPGGQGASGDKYYRARAWLTTQSSSKMPTLIARPNQPVHFKFDDGRHRFAAWRDMGHETMPFCVPLDCRDALLRHFA